MDDVDRAARRRLARAATIRRRRAAAATALAGLASAAFAGGCLAAAGGDEDRAAPAPAPLTASAVAAEATRVQRSTVERLPADALTGTLVMATFRQSGTRIPGALRRAIAGGRIGGVILFSENATTIAGARTLARRLEAIRRPAALRATPLLIAIDQEGGQVRRLSDAPPVRSALGQAASGTARADGLAAGRALRRAGVTWNFAPVADAPRRGSFMAAAGRTYGPPGTPASRIGARAAAFATGLRAAGVAATAKHFPGLGRATENTDLRRAAVPASLADLRATDVAAFRPLVEAGVPAVMLANAVYPAYGSAPAPFAPRVAGDLRDRLGFEGVVVTDDLEAAALDTEGPRRLQAVRALRAGTDVVLFARRLDTALNAQAELVRALRDGRLTRGQLEAKAARVLALRRQSAG